MKFLKRPRLSLVSVLSAGFFAGSFAYDVTVDWGTANSVVYQTMRGFGASIAEGGSPGLAGTWIYQMPEPARTQIMDYLFDSTKGIGLNMIRTELSYYMQTEGGAFDITKDNPATAWFIKEASKRGKMTCWPAPWTPPFWMKTVQTKADGSLDPAHYQDFANYMSMYIREMKRVNNIDFAGISIQNEPNFNPSYGGCLYSGAQLAAYAKVLGPTFARDGVSAKIVLADVNISAGFSSMCTAVLNDTAAVKYVGPCAYHIYDGAWPTANYATLPITKGKEIWETETSNQGGPWSGFSTDGMDVALGWARQMHACMTVTRASAWHYFWFMGGGNGGIFGASGGTYRLTKHFWSLGNWSRFVRPGYKMIACTPNIVNNSSDFVAAFKDPGTGRFAIIIIDCNAGADPITVHCQNFSPTKVTPWLTDATHDLAQVTDIPVTNGAFTYTSSGQSVVTLVGQVDPTSVAPPAVIAPMERALLTVASVRNGIMLHVQRPGSYQAELLGVDGKHLASWHLIGPCNSLVTTSNIRTGLAVLKMTGTSMSETATVMIGKQ